MDIIEIVMFIINTYITLNSMDFVDQVILIINIGAFLSLVSLISNE